MTNPFMKEIPGQADGSQKLVGSIPSDGKGFLFKKCFEAHFFNHLDVELVHFSGVGVSCIMYLLCLSGRRTIIF